ncbi:hypothetical protein BKI52_34240 [marine bacterium AO1-C]|nr:hypothetical protein BKI52_34240 [marine bacterium AO1-C]
MKSNSLNQATLGVNVSTSTHNLPIIFWEAQPNPWKLTYVSSTIYQTIPGISETSSNFWELIHPDDQGFVREQYQHTLNHQKPQTIEYRVCPTPNTYIWVRDQFETYSTPVQGLKLKGALVNIHQERLQQELLESQEQVIKEIVQITAYKSGQDYFEQIVLSLSKTIGADYLAIGEKLPNQNAIQTIVHCNQDKIIPNFSYNLEGTPCQFVVDKQTCVYPDKVAQQFPEDTMLADLEIEGYLGTPIFDHEGNGLGLIWALYKTSIKNADLISSLFKLFSSRIGAEINRLKADLALLESEKRFRRYFKADKAIRLLINPENQQIEDANPAAEAFYGYSYTELTGLKISDLHVLKEQEVIQNLRKAQDEQSNYFQFQHKIKNGQIKHIEAYSTPLEVNQKTYILATIHDITESTQNKLALLNEKQFVDSIIQHATEGICVCYEVEGFPFVRFTVWNHQMEKITGYTLEEINVLGWYQTVYPDEATSKKAATRMRQMRQGTNLIREAWTITTKNGSSRILEISTTLVHNKDNMPHVLAIMKDVTETQLAKQALEARQTRMQLLYQITSNVAEEIDEQLQQALKLTNSFFKAETTFISHIEGQDFLITNSHSITSSLPAGTNLPLDETICQLTFSQEKVIMINDLKQSHWKDQLPPIDFDSKAYLGTVVYVFGKKHGTICMTSTINTMRFNDIDAEFMNLLSRWIGNLIERKIKEQNLRESEERYRSLTESAPVGIVLHSQGIIKYINPFGQKMLEGDIHQLVGHPISKIVHPDSLDVAAKRIKMLYEKKGGFVSPMEERFITLKNNVKELMISGIAIDQDGQPAICNVFADITHLKQVEKELFKKTNQLEKANKELEELAYVASHDLKAPLANFQGLMMLMTAVDAINTKGEEYFVKMQQAVEQMQDTLNNLNKVIDMKQALGAEKEQISFQQVFDNIQSSLETQITGAQATIIADFSQAPSVFYPLLQLKSIIQNLLTNALKYRHPERLPKITIHTTQDNDQVCLMIEDNGLGMDLSKSKEKPFGLFKRLHTHVEGKGMGLYIIKSIVDSHSGQIEVRSEVDQGTIFKIYLGNE